MMYFANKGLFIRKLDGNSYVIQDVFGTCSLPFQSTEEELDEKSNNIAKVHKLVTIGVDSEFPDLSDFRWNELEHYYIAHIDYAFLACLMNREETERYHSVIGLFPVGYLECGYGDSSKYVLEHIHSSFKELCNDENFPIQEQDLELFLVTNQVKRICSDIMSLISRSISAYTELLRCHRKCIAKSYQAIEQLESKEIIHRGNDSYQAASSVTSLVISLYSSLDLSAKLIQYINSIDTSSISFKAARDKQYHEVKKIKSNFFSDKVLSKIVGIQKANADIPEIIQFRNDLIHSTSAIELEKIYVGIETDEINDMPLYYSAQYARDCLDSGQPIRFLGRDYFVEGKMDVEVKALSWIHKVIEYHVSVAEEIHSHLIAVKKPNKSKHSDAASCAGV
ncbi:TPA: hypothetical protein ACQYCV_001418 [Vibrio parahaemolyticus]|uniref:hypothetical protein n=1 Tax=Vibrio parahaemolyticus TaxID=670 RepID=UPI001EFEBDB3|nr:hypothetical protein [Vibrio parahaemolyticus]EGQ8919481.1 hypothetical protein [Vibrio parahaemolyticus]MCG9644980.1 hypothetical protein [Vibrio parahaemolyticus]HCE2382697.1 hypothetical protein [Vibrio parahaemolyticus]